MNVKSAFSDSNFAFCLLLPSLLLFPDIPRWSFYSSIIFWFYRVMIDRLEWKIPSRYVTGFFSLIFLGVTYLSFDSLIGREPSCSFLVVLLSLKILEYQNDKENGFLILLGFYLVTSKFLFDTNLIWFSLGFPTMILFIYFLLPAEFRIKNRTYAGTYVLKSILLSLPLGLFLFFYFPRFSTDIFNFKAHDNKIQNVGFSETIEPGSVSSLIQNDEVVLRASFIGLRPSINNLYWRGLTLTQQEGLVWKRDLELESTFKLSPTFSLDTPHVQITLEPTYKNWIFSLDQTTDLTSSQMIIYKLPQGIYKSENTIDNRFLYQLKYESTQKRKPVFNENTKVITIKEKPSFELKKLLNQISKESDRSEDIIDQFSEFLIKNSFQYTLSPGDKGQLSIDEFLFKTKQGFCEHYASVTAILLNHLNIPARVVTGYHGGEYNPLGHFWTIRQRDAHAWIEYLDSSNQWRRFDPTAVIAPMRLALGAFDYSKMNNLETISNFSALNLNFTSDSYIRKISYFFEDLNYRWNSVIVNFDIERQKKILKDMKISIPEAILYGMLFTLILSLTLSWFLRNRISMTRSQKIFRLINSHFENYGLAKQATEGPETWKTRASNAFPEQTRKINALFDCYIAEAYANKSSQSNLSRVKQLLRSL